MKSEALISIIIPVYNVEEYLRQCINSIISQTYDNIEIILIDDGSTDESGEICDEFAKQDSRIKVIHKENGGVSKARNIGIKIAKGKYMAFVDPDDFLEKNIYEEMIKYMNEETLVICDFSKIMDDKVIEETAKQGIERLTPKDTLSKITLRQGFQPYIWNKLFSSKLIKQNQLKFDENIYFCEDLCFVAKYCTYIKDSIHIQIPLYHYRIRSNSALNNSDLKRRLTILVAYEYLIDLYHKNNTESLLYLEYWYLKEALDLRCRMKVNKKCYFDECNKVENKINQYYNKILKSEDIKFREKLNVFIFFHFPKTIYYLKKYMR